MQNKLEKDVHLTEKPSLNPLCWLRKKIRHDRRGMALTEFMLYSVLAGAALAIIYGYYSTSQVKARIDNTQTQLVNLRVGVQNLFRGQKYESIDNTMLQSANVLPKEAWRGTTPYNPFTGTYVVAAAGTDGDSFSILIDKLPQAACVALAQFGGEWLSVDVNGTPTPGEELPVSAATATTACNPDNANKITYFSN